VDIASVWDVAAACPTVDSSYLGATTRRTFDGPRHFQRYSAPIVCPAVVNAIWMLCGLFLIVSAVVRLRGPGADRKKPAMLAAAGVALIVIGIFI